jgi:YidC/Oxa1 family membrane protein insertase
MFETFFYQPILNLLIFLYNIVPGHDLGIAIILLTIIVKFALLPLTKKQLQSQKALQELQPKIDEIKKKYKDKKEEMGKAMMDVYKNNKVNPLSSCLPVLVQMPFLFAIFKVFRDGFENGAFDLLYPFISRPESIDYFSFGIVDLAKNHNIYLAVAAGLAQFYQGKLMQTKRPSPKVDGSKDEDMAAIMNKQMMVFMPFLTAMISYQFSAGLALYWFISTCLLVFQQLFIFKKTTKNEIIEGEIVK